MVGIPGKLRRGKWNPLNRRKGAADRRKKRVPTKSIPDLIPAKGGAGWTLVRSKDYLDPRSGVFAPDKRSGKGRRKTDK